MLNSSTVRQENPEKPEFQGLLPIFYQSQKLLAYGNRMIHGFSQKPHTVGGPDFDRSLVLSHREALCQALNLPVENLVVPAQTHSKTVRHHTDTNFSATDGIILTQPGIPVMLMFADCTPVLLYDPNQHVGAVVHAGWRGTSQAITQEAIQQLIQHYGVSADQLIGVVGPSIGACCYEVSQEVVTAVKETLPEHAQSKLTHPNPDPTRANPHVDLKWANTQQMIAAGLSPDNVEVMSTCTQCQPETLWSYRRGEHGRQAAIMMLL